MSWQTTVHPWSYDFDYLGHLTAAVYPKAFEQARVEYLRNRWQTRSPAYVVAAHRMQYLKEILEENAPIQVVIRPVRLGQSSIDLTELLLDANGVVCNRSASTLVAWDVAARRSRRLTTSERDALTDDVESTPQTHPRGPIPADKTGDRNPQ
ncbi:MULTISPECIES: acyl-CoA thioesterase [unclassified Mycolicibacterium]|uniref:acyl-CoA thioesterase n=1 Tax=unclassified Mycolicibacterium TaxID=2636767 RepID=UPI001391369D|nr:MULTISPECIES: acyl-CoA thioesterase [unclassified Mycolicibacterium]